MVICQRLKRSQGIYDLRFHDLRHEAISRFFERGLSIAEVALISGHKDPRMLFRYTRIVCYHGRPYASPMSRIFKNAVDRPPDLSSLGRTQVLFISHDEAVET